MSSVAITEHVTFDRSTKAVHIDKPCTISASGDRLFIDITHDDGSITSVAVDREFLQ